MYAMEEIVRAMTEYPLITTAICFAVLLILYFLFKRLIKPALILIIVAVAIGGYFYFQYPESRPANFKDAVKKARTGAGRAVDRGKEAYKKGKELLDKKNEAYKKGKEWVDKGKTVLDQGIDKGKDAVEKGKDAAGNIAEIMGGDREAGDRQH
jgi:Flp pilus assembly pilin Flp